MTRSRVLWFFGVLAVATPVLLAAFVHEEGMSSDAWGNTLVMAAAVATATALVWGKREAEGGQRT